MCILKLLCVYVCYTINKDQSINQSNVSSEEKCLQRRLETVQGRRVANARVEQGNRFHAAGPATTNARPLNCKVARREQTTEFDLQHRNLRRARKICRGHGVRVTCDVGYLCANFNLPRPLCSRLRPDVRDRQTSDIRQHHSLLNAHA